MRDNMSHLSSRVIRPTCLSHTVLRGLLLPLCWALACPACSREDSMGKAGNQDASASDGNGMKDATPAADTVTTRDEAVPDDVLSDIRTPGDVAVVSDTRLSEDMLLFGDMAPPKDVPGSGDTAPTKDAPLSSDAPVTGDLVVWKEVAPLGDAVLSTDLAPPSLDAGATCTSMTGGVYHVGEVIQYSPPCNMVCKCLEGGIVGQCTGGCPSPDAGTDLGTSADAGPDLGTSTDGAAPADLCTASGGQISSGLCCTSATDFPNSCLDGACSCSSTNSHTVSICTCGAGCYLPGYGCVGATGVCTVGADQSCNNDLTVSMFHGRCLADGRCLCNSGFALLANGKCQ